MIVVGASRGESLDIPCEIEADPPARSYRWKFNNSGETLDVAAARYASTSNGTTSILKYTPVSDLDYGTLTCWAINFVGHQEQPCVFQVFNSFMIKLYNTKITIAIPKSTGDMSMVR